MMKDVRCWDGRGPQTSAGHCGRNSSGSDLKNTEDFAPLLFGLPKIRVETRALSLGLDLLLQELNPFLFLLHLAMGTLLSLKSSPSVLEELLLPAVEHRRPQAQFLTQVRDGHLVQKVSPQDGYFLFCGVMLPFLPHTFAPLS